jgi:hypothetical protein
MNQPSGKQKKILFTYGKEGANHEFPAKLYNDAITATVYHRLPRIDKSNL